MNKLEIKAFIELKQGDDIYNVTFDSFKRLTLKSVEIKELPREYIGSDEKFYSIDVETEEGTSIFKDSGYRCDDWFANKESAEQERNRLIEYHNKQIEQHTKNLSKLIK